MAARGKVRVVVAKKAEFSGRCAEFTDILEPACGEAKMDDIDVVVLCTGYRTDFSWLDVEGLDWNPRTWFKHCFPGGHGDKLMFIGWARPHQGGIPACGEMLARYVAMVLDGSRVLPADYAERALKEAADEHAFYVHARHAANLVDYPAFMDSVARLIGCLPETPRPTQPERLVQYCVYPNWPFWYRMNGPGAKPRVVETILSAFPLAKSFAPSPINVMALAFSLMQLPIDAMMPRRSGFHRGWSLKTKKTILHDNT